MLPECYPKKAHPLGAMLAQPPLVCQDFLRDSALRPFNADADRVAKLACHNQRIIWMVKPGHPSVSSHSANDTILR